MRSASRNAPLGEHAGLPRSAFGQPHSTYLDYGNRAVVVAVGPVVVVEVVRNEVIGMIAVWNGLVPAALSMLMPRSMAAARM